MLTNKQKQFLDKYVEGSWSENDQGLIDVNGNVDFSDKRYKTIPVKFGFVSGGFWCNNNQLTSLKGAPKNVGGSFYCNHNRLISLEGAPKSINGDFYCYNNQLTSLEGAPESVGGGSFWCSNNQLTSLEGAPKNIGGSFWCDNERKQDKEYILWAIKKKLN
jgi:hypothetical protein